MNILDINLISGLVRFFTLLTLAALTYQVLALNAMVRFFRRPLPSPGPTRPGLTVLKPVRGVGPETRACLESFLTQDYAPFQVLFGVADGRDPVVSLLHDLQCAHPGCEMEIIICPQALGANPKVSTLRQLLPQARHDYLVISDSDIIVGPDYLGVLGAALQEEGVGLVTCPYRGGPAATLGAALETLTIGSDFIPSVAMAYYVEGISFGLGATLAFPRQALPEIGGLEALADYLADDYQLGHRLHQAGYRITLVPYVVETADRDQSLVGFLAHQLRWARTYRVCRPAGYFAYGLTFALPHALLTALASGGAPIGLALVLAALLARLSLAYVSQWLVLGGRLPLAALALLPLRDLAAFVLWAASFLGNRVQWQGRDYRVDPGGKLILETS